jgi:flagellar hook-associated protein 2
VTNGTFTVNGSQVTLATSDTLQEVFDKINTATGGTVTATYDSAADKVTLSSAGEIVLGSANDTTNFLQALKLSNNGTGTVSSLSSLGTIRASAKLNAGNFAAAVSDGGAGAGEFKINGVSIQFNAANDTATDVLARINASSAGVNAGYDAINDRFVITYKTTGDLGIGMEDVTGNFLAAAGLAGGTLNRGNDLLYSVNGGGQLVSQSNTITSSSSAITGLTVTALQTGSVTIDVKSDTDKIRTAITDFLGEYNKSQSMIDAETASSTDAKGLVTKGDLAGESEANELSAKLRSLVNATVSGLTGSFSHLSALGIASNGTDDTLALKEDATLEAALAGNLDHLRHLFTHETDGLAVKLGQFLEGTVGDEGALKTKQNNLSKQIAGLDVQISDMERLVLSNEQRLIDSFISMERAQALMNQQMQFLNQRLGINS